MIQIDFALGFYFQDFINASPKLEIQPVVGFDEI